MVRSKIVKPFLSAVIFSIILYLFFLMTSLIESELKKYVINVIGVSETDLIASKVYDMSNKCGMFTSDMDCLGAVNIKIDLAQDIGVVDKVKAKLLAKKIIFLY